ncbi:MAG: alpha-galactosidase [Lewinellaceae bacterium]|nr:alpha-galactosidase [Lewinellaceae bacterium]MCB9353834.1 alpha-galactosidase [Lewinellaceae bacterium]
MFLHRFAMHIRQTRLVADNNTYLLNPGRPNSFEDIYADFQQQEESGGERFSIFLHPKQDVTVRRLEIEFDLPLPSGARFFANGYQSWSESRLMSLNDSIPRLRGIARSRMGLYGDEHVPDIPHGAGYLHSWTYTYLSGFDATHASDVLFCGSLNERTGFTIFLYDRPNGVLRVRKDMDGLRLQHSFPALDFWIGQGSEQAMFDRYFQLLGIAPPSAAPAFGWTSWYRHFNHISEELVLRELDAFANTGPEPHAYFQIDDGWQNATGDWLSSGAAFPKGMQYLAQQIHSRSLQPGLWLAPFVAEKHSELVKQHPGWLLKDAKGRPLKAGWNPLWKGWYYALDFYNNDVRNYLGGVFHMALEKWGFEILKLDFLFAACLAPPPGKTRGQVMGEAMEFMRKLAGPKKILACGVPLGAAFGLADYCRIGGDAHLHWEHRLLAFLRHRERVSTLASLRSTLGRWQLDGRAFHNDPDVFVLRSERQHLSPAQQQLLLTINALLGGVLFTSDDLSKYTPEQTAELEAALELRGSRVAGVSEPAPDFYVIAFEQNNTAYTVYCNLNGREQTFAVGGETLQLAAYEHLILRKQ